MPYLTIKARLRGAPERFAILRDAMLSATKVYNGLIFHLKNTSRMGKSVIRPVISTVLPAGCHAIKNCIPMW